MAPSMPSSAWVLRRWGRLCSSLPACTRVIEILSSKNQQPFHALLNTVLHERDSLWIRHGGGNRDSFSTTARGRARLCFVKLSATTYLLRSSMKARAGCSSSRFRRHHRLRRTMTCPCRACECVQACLSTLPRRDAGGARQGVFVVLATVDAR